MCRSHRRSLLPGLPPLVGLLLAAAGTHAQGAPGPRPRLESLLRAQEVLLAPPGAEVWVRRGRAGMIHDGAVRRLVPASGRVGAGGGAYLELGVGSEVEVSWPGRASLRVRGPASLDWSEADPLRPALRIASLGSLELEVRRGGPTLDLPGGWRLEAAGGALGVVETGAALELSHHGGAALRVRSWLAGPTGAGSAGNAGGWVLPGARLRLPPLAR